MDPQGGHRPEFPESQRPEFPEAKGDDVFANEEVFPMHALAMEETVTCGAKKADLEELILKNPGIGLKCMKNMGGRLSSLARRIGSMSVGDLEDRIYQILLGIARRHGALSGGVHRIEFPLTHEELGFLANAHRVSVTKAVGKLLRSGRLVKHGKVYSLPGWASES